MTRKEERNVLECESLLSHQGYVKERQSESDWEHYKQRWVDKTRRRVSAEDMRRTWEGKEKGKKRIEEVVVWRKKRKNLKEMMFMGLWDPYLDLKYSFILFTSVFFVVVLPCFLIHSHNWFLLPYLILFFSSSLSLIAFAFFLFCLFLDSLI